jgi:hypothetical protein
MIWLNCNKVTEPHHFRFVFAGESCNYGLCTNVTASYDVWSSQWEAGGLLIPPSPDEDPLTFLRGGRGVPSSPILPHPRLDSQRPHGFLLSLTRTSILGGARIRSPFLNSIKRLITTEGMPHASLSRFHCLTSICDSTRSSTYHRSKMRLTDRTIWKCCNC